MRNGSFWFFCPRASSKKANRKSNQCDSVPLLSCCVIWLGSICRCWCRYLSTRCDSFSADFISRQLPLYFLNLLNSLFGKLAPPSFYRYAGSSRPLLVKSEGSFIFINSNGCLCPFAFPLPFTFLGDLVGVTALISPAGTLDFGP